jgi:uroporphyrinogen-III synthase
VTGPGVVVTRDEGPKGRLTRMLRALGATVYHWPTIRTVPAADPGPLDRALAALDGFDWTVITSRRVAEVLAGRGITPPEGLSVAAVGESTAEALTRVGWPVDLVPDPQTGEALVSALIERGVGSGARVLFPASSIARDAVPDGLTAAGAEVVQVVAYRTEPASLDRPECRRLLRSGEVDVITFTSPSTVRGLEAGLGAELMRDARRLRAVVIGPTTADAARAAGFEPIVAEPHSLEGLARRVAGVAARESIEEA